MWLNGSSSLFSNQTFSPNQWNAVPILRIVMVFFTVSINTAVITAFFYNDRLIHNPFMIYLINLLVNNIVYGLFANTMNILVNLHANSFDWMDRTICGVYLYSNYTGVGIVMNCHALVTLNRIWAIVFPVSYRNKHTTKIAVMLCGAMFLYVHAFVLPGIIQHSLRHESERCDWQVRELMTWRHMMQLIIYDCPLLFVLGAYPFLFWKRRQIHKEALMRKASFKHNTQTHAFLKPPRQTPLRSHSVTCESEERRDLYRRSKSLSINYRKVSPVLRRHLSGSDGPSGHGFLVLTLLTVSVLICWFAPHVFWTVIQFKELPEKVTMIWGAVIPSILYPVQAVADPILFAIALPDLRAVFCRLCKKKSSMR